MIDFSKPSFLWRDGFKLALYEAGPKTGYPLILVHGWPEMAYSWSPVMHQLAGAGIRVIAFDLRGFGYSDAPIDPEHYGIANLVSDIEAILNHIGAAKACIAGHDWGGIIVWHAARMLRQRVSHVISLCTPHVSRAPIDPLDIFRTRHGDEHYFVHFNDRRGEAETLFSQDPDALFRQMFRSTPKTAKPSSEMYAIPARFKAFLAAGAPDLPGAIMSASHREVYVNAYKRSGFHGGINLYRNTSENWKLADGLSDNISQPSLMISARQDLFLPPSFADPMANMVPDLERHIIEDCGHWMMWEQPEMTARLMLDWLARRLNSYTG